MSKELKQQAVTGVVWSMIETYSGQLVSFSITVILARLLTPTDYGLIGLLGIFMGLSNTFIDGGFSMALIQCKNRSEKDFSTVFFINFTIALLIYTILFFSAPLISEFYHQPLLIPITRVYCLTLLIGSLCSTSSVQLSIKLEFKTTTKISLICGVISGLIGLYMAYNGYGVWALVAQSITSNLLRLFLLYIFVRWIPRYGFSKDSFKKLFSFSSKLFVASIISSIYANITGAVIGKQFNAADLAYYNRGKGYNALFNDNVVSVLGRVSYPLLSQIQDEQSRLKSVYEKYIQMSAFLTFPVLMILCGVAKPFIILLLTEKWAPCIIMLQILSFSFLFNGVVVSNLNLIKVIGRSDLVLKLEIIKKAIAFTILGICIFIDNVLAFCIGEAIYGCCFALYLNTYYTKKILNYGFKEQFSGFLPYLLLSLLVLGISLTICHFIDSCFLSLFTSVIVSVVVYLFLCSKFKLYAYLEMKNILSPVIKKLTGKKI